MLYFPKNYFKDPILSGQISVPTTAFQKTPLTVLCCLIIQAWHRPRLWRARKPPGDAGRDHSPPQRLKEESHGSSCPRVPHPWGILSWASWAEPSYPSADLRSGTGCPKHSLFLFNHCHKKGQSRWHHFVKFQKELKPSSFFFPTEIYRCESRSHHLSFFTDKNKG